MRANRSRVQRGEENGRERADGEIKGRGNGEGKEGGRRGRMEESVGCREHGRGADRASKRVGEGNGAGDGQ